MYCHFVTQFGGGGVFGLLGLLRASQYRSHMQSVCEEVPPTRDTSNHLKVSTGIYENKARG